ncbi:MAG TPA: hypothetical protein VGH87_01520, partial [Polyangiaceae bacterium]
FVLALVLRGACHNEEAMMDDSITVEILKDIRNELQTTRTTLHQDISELRQELSDVRQQGRETLDELRETREQLVRRGAETEIRLSTEIVAHAAVMAQIRDALRAGVQTKLNDHERRIAALEKKRG